MQAGHLARERMDTAPHHARTDEILLHLLVMRCQAGDDRAFAGLLERFGPRTLRYLAGILGDDAEDVHQEVWLAVYRRVAQLGAPGAFVTWLFTVARHRAVDFLRRRRRERELLEGVAAELVAGDGSEGTDETEPEGFELAAAMARLPTLQREVLLLRYREDLSYEEIALVVGCAVGTVRSRLHHARRRLQESMARTEGPAPQRATARCSR